MPIRVIVTIIPRPSKEDFTWSKLAWLADQVKQHEPGVSSYRYGRNDGSYGDKGFVVNME
jgi:hypothetical protein